MFWGGSGGPKCVQNSKPVPVHVAVSSCANATHGRTPSQPCPPKTVIVAARLEAVCPRIGEDAIIMDLQSFWSCLSTLWEKRDEKKIASSVGARATNGPCDQIWLPGCCLPTVGNQR
eukprot:2305986-Amphidinium_carterae.1